MIDSFREGVLVKPYERLSTDQVKWLDRASLNILEDSPQTKRNVRLKTSHASIRMAVPEILSATINASTSFGKIRCDFPILMNLGNVDINSSNRSKINGTVGDGKDSIDLEASFANITIEKM